MYNLNSSITQILKFDKLHNNIDFDKFNGEEKELLKFLCYKNHALNFQYHYKKKFNKKIYYLILNFYNFFLFIFSLKKKILILFNFSNKKKYLKNIKTDIIFFLSQSAKDHEDTYPIIKRFTKKVILVDCSSEKLMSYKKLIKNCKIINLQDYIQIKDFFLAFIKSIKFIIKFAKLRKTSPHPLLNSLIYFRFFIRIEVYKKILGSIETNKVFIDRNNEEGNNFFISSFKNKNKLNKVFSYSLNGLALNNDLISSHYLYSNIDYLFCYGKFDKIFIKKLFKRNRFKLLKIPNKIIPVGSIRNFLHKKIKNTKNKTFTKKFNFLYIKSNPFIYNNLDQTCFKKFCYFINKNFPLSLILVKERNSHTSKKDVELINKKLITKKNIYNSSSLKPENLFSNADFIVGTTSAALAQAIYYNKPVICLDNKIVISSFLKYFSSIYISSIDEIANYTNKISILGNKHLKQNKIKDLIFKKTYKSPCYEILKVMKR
tara:strand:+ start:810 stop:2273 length:1464 start_codon:yes stop_codon:yes gene_type:complete